MPFDKPTTAVGTDTHTDTDAGNDGLARIKPLCKSCGFPVGNPTDEAAGGWVAIGDIVSRIVAGLAARTTAGNRADDDASSQS
jgi:hypothetical protein